MRSRKMAVGAALLFMVCCEAVGADAPIERMLAGYTIEKSSPHVALRDDRTGSYLIRTGE